MRAAGIALLLLVAPGVQAAFVLRPGFEDTLYLAGLPNGIHRMAFSPDGDLWVVGNAADVWIVPPGGPPALLVTLPVPATLGQRWCTQPVVGMAFDPAFGANGRVYFYVVNQASEGQILRYSVSGGSATFEAAIVTGLPAGPCVQGGFAMGPDGFLYLSVGTDSASNPQDLSSVRGKVLRIDGDGQAPPGNPFASVPGADPRIWALGFWEAGEIVVDGDRLLVFEEGDSEINVLYPGGNYGAAWGPCSTECHATFVRPLPGPSELSWQALEMGASYGTGPFPAVYHGSLFYGLEQGIWFRSSEEEDGLFAEGANSLADMEVGPDGALYYLLDFADEVHRIAYGVPVADFCGAPLMGPPPLAVDFQEATSAATSLLWDFGDGGTATGGNPTHVYATPGTYTVTLTAAGTLGTDVETKVGYVYVGPVVDAAFAGTPLSGPVPLSVSFQDQSAGSPSQWSWSFGDGGVSTAQHPTHAYQDSGLYTVSLCASSATSMDTETRTGYVAVGPAAEFSGGPTWGLAPLQVAFASLSAGSPASFSWSFGDGATSALPDPVHVYAAPGIYDVSLTVTNAFGTDVEIKPGFVTVGELPVAGFSATPTSGAAPLQVAFTDQSTGGPTSFAWTFGDGATSTNQAPVHVYAVPGTYDVSLTVASAFGSDAELRQDYVTVFPAATPNLLSGLGADPTAPSRVQAWDASSQPYGPIDFAAYGTPGYGVDVAAGDLDGAAEQEMLTGPGPSTVYGPHVRGFRSPTAAPISKVSFFAYGTLRYGVHPARGDIDGDGIGEILTSPGPGASFGPHVRAFNWDGATLGAMAKVSFFAFATLRYGAHVDAGSIDPDRFAELVTAPGPGPTFGASVRGFNYDGIAVSAMGKVNFVAHAGLLFGAEVALGDVDGDFMTEILTGPGAGAANPTEVRGFDFDGIGLTALPGLSFEAYAGEAYGVRLASGDLHGTGTWDLLTVPASPFLPARVLGFAYDGSGVTPLPAIDFVADPAYRYGGNVAVGSLGF